MSKLNEQISPGGSRILSHAQGCDFAPARGHVHADVISAHGKRHLGPMSNVLHAAVDVHTRIDFLSLAPLCPQEMALKLRQGTYALTDLMSDNDIGDVIEPGRHNPAREHLSGISA
ncbi:suppressor of fused domain protein [Stenotrophomonas terrae]|nr:suppressor of fused domain protein [Stenotrophomonas terrae]